MKLLLSLLLLLVLAVTGFAADPTITAVAGTPTSSGCAITGTNTCDATVAGVTNSVTITVFFGGADGGTDPLAWSRSSALADPYARFQAWTNTLSGLTPNTIIYYRARAQDLGGTAWSTASTVFTTATSAAFAPDVPWRGKIVAGSNTLSVVSINGTNYTVGIKSVVAADGTTNTVIKLTP